MYTLERKLFRQGLQRIAGIDEAGRGPLAGPVVAAAVVLPPHRIIDGINDSKKLAPPKRKKLYHEIIACADVGIGIVSEKVIDEINIYEATRLAMKHAVLDLPEPPVHLLIDGRVKIELSIDAQCIKNGDCICASIAAASIIAKVTRDELMIRLHADYPHYFFDKHKGYPTKEHRRLLSQFGASPVHRLSFRPVKNIRAQSGKQRGVHTNRRALRSKR